ncbi:MAG: NAD-dependent epimerase/dehydratase family protein [Myxococcales bacterium]|nr:NAD-dependent epimerase/dehydratase family protein [Myxococcales bacterium]
MTQQPNRRQRALITGGAGFIGSALARVLLASFDEITVLDNLATGRRENLAELPPGRVRFVEGDVRDSRLLDDCLPGAAVVYHLACLGVRHSLHAPRENFSVNAEGTLAVLEAARRHRTPRLVHVSSSEVYGDAGQTPMTEDHPCRPNTVYAAGKLAGEALVRALARTADLPAVIVRPFNTYGPRSHHEGDSGEVIPKFLLRGLAGRPLVVFGDGEQTRDFLYVDDTARGIAAAGLVPAAVGLTLNLGSGREISIRELAGQIGPLIGRPETAIEFAPARPGDTRRLLADAGLARRVLNFTPAVSLEEGLRALLAWYRARPVSPEELLREEITFNWRTPDGAHDD